MTLTMSHLLQMLKHLHVVDGPQTAIDISICLGWALHNTERALANLERNGHVKKTSDGLWETK